MADENWQKIREIFDSALSRQPEERQKYITEVCGTDYKLLSEVESLLASLDSADSFLEQPAVTKVAKVIPKKSKKLVTGQNLGHYQILEQIGTGGMGEVYLAEDKRLERRVAIKILNTQFAGHESNLQRFIREARAASALNHPSILVIHEIGEEDEAHFIVSEYIKGKTLREILREKSLKLSEVLDIVIQIANALNAAHEARLVHRDIKPENVMIRPDGFIKVLDFGLAKLVEEKHKSFLGLGESIFTQNDTAKGVILGTVNYMSPEQAKGEKVDERTDIFSLGAVIYEMLTGRTPFAGDSISETFANLIHIEPQPLSVDLPDELQRIVLKMLCKKKEERYQSSKDLIADLKKVKEYSNWEAKPEYSAKPRNGNATEFLPTTTGDANKTTTQNQNSFSLAIQQNKPLAAFALIALLICSIGIVYYFYITKNTTLAGKKSIAVLPLKPINTANRDELYEFGIADSLITKFGAMKGFVVRPLSATRKYSDLNQDPIAAGREQQVDYVLTSNYQLADGKIRITAQLFNVSNGQIEETYKGEKNVGDLFAMQDAIAGELGNKLLTLFATTEGSPTAKRGTNNEEAYRLYLQGKNLTMRRNKEWKNKSIECFEQAIKLDPNYALAYARMAFAYYFGGISENSAANAAKVRELVNKALELDPNLAEAYVARGFVSGVYDWDPRAAEKDYLSAIELEPNNDTAHWLYAMNLSNRGRFNEAFAEIETAQTIDPDAAVYMWHRGQILYYARRYDEAITQFQQVIDLDDRPMQSYEGLSRVYEIKGDYVTAYQFFLKSEERSKRNDRLEIYQKAYQTAGWMGVRRKILEFSKPDEPRFPGGAFNIAKECAMLGEKELALDYLNKAVENRRWLISTLNVEPAFDSLRDDPRFDELVNRFGLR